MPLNYFRCSDFRCLRSAELALDPRYNLIYGPNASGKTSLLEAVAYLGRGRSFRGASPEDLVRHGATEFVLFGRTDTGSRETAIGVRNGSAGLKIHVDGDVSSSVAALAEALPLQVLDPDLHDLVAGGPEGRRRYIDWIAFHVEHGYLERWRRFRRALRQRNAALKDDAGREALTAWDREFTEAGREVHEARLRVLDMARPALEAIGAALLGCAVGVEYRQGWNPDSPLDDALKAGIARDRQLGASQSGPHRAELKLRYDKRQARRLVSRGQQKLLASALVIAATEVVQSYLERPLLLLLDDPAAELDEESLARLMDRVIALGSQVIATALDPGSVPFPEPACLFHVEQGRIEREG